MPTYQYVCTNPEVKHEFERVQSFSDPAVTVCPECGAPVRKVYGSVGVVFKGSGFYRTDSRKAEKAPSGAAAGSSTSSSGGDSASSSSSSGNSSGNSSGSASSSSTGGSGSSGSSSKAANAG